MNIGSLSVSTSMNNKGKLRKILALLLSFALTVSLFPNAAWANEAASAGSSAEAVSAASAASNQLTLPDADLSVSASPAPDLVVPEEKVQEPVFVGSDSAIAQASKDLPTQPQAQDNQPAPSRVEVADSPTAQQAQAAPVVGFDSLEAAAKELENASFKPNPEYGKSANLNKLVETKLAELGYEHVSVTTKSAVAKQENSNATGGVSVAQDDTNGDVTFFFMDPDSVTASSSSYILLRQFNFTFLLSDGKTTYEYTPYFAGTIPWDDEKMLDLLEVKTQAIAVGISAGDSLESVTKNVTLPYKIYDASGVKKNWSSVTWSSSDTASLAVTGASWEDYTGKVTRLATDQTVVLTANLSVISSGGPEVVAKKEIEVTVKGDPDKIAADKAALNQKVAKNFTYENISYVNASGLVDPTALSSDLRLPTPRTMQVDGKYYEVKYIASSDAIEINSYAGKVFCPLPGSPATPSDITVVVTSKANPEITATKTLSFSVAPLLQSGIDRELALMEAARAGYFEALAEGQSASAVSKNMHAFQKVSFDENSSLKWLYDSAEADKHTGIVLVDLEGYDSMGATGWRLFKSSNAGVVTHENLLVVQPEFNTKVTVSSCLSSEAYARYAERYPSSEVFQKLSRQSVSATFVVQGTSGQQDPFVEATWSVIGVDKQGATQTWSAAQPFTLESGASAAELSEKAFTKSGLSRDSGTGSYGYYLNTVTSPFDAGHTLGWDAVTGKFWQLFINGSAASVGADGYVLESGDSVVWCYSAWGDKAPTDQLSVKSAVLGADVAGVSQIWAAESSYELAAGSTAADLSEKMFSQRGLTRDSGAGTYGYFLNSITSPYDKNHVLSSKESTPGVWKYWQLFINGKLSGVGASDYVLKAGDVVVWCYGADGLLPGQIASTCEVVGSDAEGNVQTWASKTDFKMIEGATAADVSEQALVYAGLKASIDMSYGWYLSSLVSPYDDKVELGWNQETGKYWRLFINGKPSTVGASGYAIEPGDAISWYYSSDSDSSLPDGSLVIDPDASRPSYDSSWAGFGNGSMGGAVVNRPTPTTSAELSWTYRYAQSAVGVSDPLIVNGDIYLVVSGELIKIDSATGSIKAKTSIGGTISYLCRPVYVDGVIIVPSDGGNIAAFTADKLTCVWKTKASSIDKDDRGYQSLSSLTINNGYVYAGFTAVGAGGRGVSGVLVCVNIKDGSIVWEKETSGSSEAESSVGAGYYWAGAAASGNDLIMGNEAGEIILLDGLTGEIKSVLPVGAPCRAGIVSVPSAARASGSNNYVAVTTDGVLHNIARKGDVLHEVGSVAFAGKSTSTPAVTGGKAFVGAVDNEGYGTLAVIDVASMTTERVVRGGKGEAQGSPLVSVQGGNTYVYFTCNGNPGGVYGYRLGDADAYALYTPSSENQQYSVASIVSDERGNLYYTNDSGVLFALSGKEGVRVAFESNGGSYVSPCYVATGLSLVQPPDPVRKGYVFAGWYADQAMTISWDFALSVTSSMTLYAKWIISVGSDQGDAGQGGNSQTPEGGLPSLTNRDTVSAKPSFGGTVAPAQSPVVPESTKNKLAEITPIADGKLHSKDAVSSAPLAGSAAPFSAEVASEGVLQGGLNALAVAGIAVGVLGLIGAVGYGAFARRRIASASASATKQGSR